MGIFTEDDKPNLPPKRRVSCKECKKDLGEIYDWDWRRSMFFPVEFMCKDCAEKKCEMDPTF